ncbi:MAG: amidohydrolase family protein [Thermoplasmata archaeon]
MTDSNGTRSGATDGPFERGQFTLHKVQQPIGEESYEIERSAEGLTAKVKFRFVDRGATVALTATFRGASDLSPVYFEVDGKDCRQSEIHRAVEIRDGRARVRDWEVWTDAPFPRPCFTISGYAPFAFQMLLLRYWAMHGSPSELPTLPFGSVRIARRGQELVRRNGTVESLDRYSIEGLIWGRETVWCDAEGRLIAAVTRDAEMDRFEATRAGYEAELDQFIRGAAADEMAVLSELSHRLSANPPALFAVVRGTLIDGTGAPAVPDSTIVVRNGKIVAAGPRSAVTVPAGATEVDATGLSVLPGLWDMHAHFQQVEWGPIYLAAGVTTVRDCGNELGFITAVRDAIAPGKGLGPRILAAGFVDGRGPIGMGIVRVDSPEEAERWVARYHAAGFQQIKVYSSMKLDAVKAVAEAAHRRGMSVTGHVPVGLTADQVILVGQDQLNHIGFVAEMLLDPPPEAEKAKGALRSFAALDLESPRAREGIAFLKAHRTVVDPTLALFELRTISTANPPGAFEPGVDRIPSVFSDRFRSLGPSTPQIEQRAAGFRKLLALTGALHRAGVPIVAGTDQSVPGHSLHRELELYVEAGLSPMEAIQSATIVPAEVLGLERESGTIEVGKRADLILVDGDPLERIRNIRNVVSVIVGGRQYACDDLWRSVGFRPRSG